MNWGTTEVDTVFCICVLLYVNMHMQIHICAYRHFCKESSSADVKLSHFILVALGYDGTSIVRAVKRMSLGKRHLRVN